MTGSEIFSLANQSLRLDTQDDIISRIEPLKSSPTHITHLNLSGNTIGVPAAEALAPYLSALTNLQEANFADIFTSRLLSEIPAALDALLVALLQCKKLHTVNLSDNAFGLNTAGPLVKFLEKHTPLRHLILNNNGLGPEAGTLVANALEKLAQAKRDACETQMLETVVCGRNRLENGSSPSWARALAAHASHLREIRMSQNGIRMEGTQAILRLGLRDAANLETLDLQDNLFTASAALALAEALPGWASLRELQVADTLMRPRGGRLLGTALAAGKNSKLEVLRLQYNEIDAKGVHALLDAVKLGSLPALRRVELNGNKFNEEDPAIEELGQILSERKGKSIGDEDDNEDDDAWGLDELDELEEDSEEEDEDEASDTAEKSDQDEEEEREEVMEKELQHTDEAENENVAQKKDADVDALADKLDKTAI